MQRNDFGHSAVEHRQARDAIALGEAAVGRRAAHHAGDLGARHEWQLRLVLVEPARLQRVRKRHPGRVHVDQDRAVVGRLIDFDELGGLWSVETGYLNCAHRTI